MALPDTYDLIDAASHPAVPPRERSRSRGKGDHAVWLRLRPFVLGAISLGAVLFAWWLAVVTHAVNPLFLPAPSEVGAELWNLVTGSRFWSDLGVSGFEFGVGLAIAIVLGGVIGVLMGWFSPVDGLIRPLVVTIHATPMVAIIPLIILIFGIGVLPKIIVVVLGCSVTIILNTAAGVINVEENLLQMARSFRASAWQSIKTVVAPAVVPYFMAGVRIAVGQALIGVVTAEFLASNAGLGNLLITASNSFDMPRVYATVIILAALGLTLTQLTGLLERYIQRWKG